MSTVRSFETMSFLRYAKNYFLGALVALLWYMGRACGHIKVFGEECIPTQPRKLLVYANHPSLYEPFLLHALFAREYLGGGLKYAPFSTPDFENYSTGLMSLASDYFIYVLRGESSRAKKMQMCALREMCRVLQDGHNLVLFPEGGRTGKGTAFIYSESGKYKVRPFTNGLGSIIRRTECYVLPVWVDGADKVLPIGARFPNVRKNVTLRIGTPISGADLLRENIDITRTLEKRLLELADETVLQQGTI